MPKSFHVRTPRGLALSAALELTGAIKLDKTTYDKGLAFVLKIDAEDFSDSSTVDYKSALIIESLQKDVLGIFNAATGQNIALKDVCNYPDLIVKVSIEEGCLKYVAKIFESTVRLAELVAPEERVLILKYIMGTAAIISFGWLSTSIVDGYSAYKVKQLDYEIRKLDEAKEKNSTLKNLEKIISENSRTPATVAKVVPENAKVTFEYSPVVSGRALKKKTESKEPTQMAEQSHYVDSNYKVLQYNFDKQMALIQDNCRPFWAFTAHLNQTDRGHIKVLANRAIDSGTSKAAPLQVTVSIVDGKIEAATIVGVGIPRRQSIPLTQAKGCSTPSQKDSLQQGNLMNLLTDAQQEPNIKALPSP